MLWSILTQNQCPLFDFDAKLICWTVCSVSTKNLTESETVSVKHNCQDWRCMQWEMVRAQTDVNSPNFCHFLGIYININPYIWLYMYKNKSIFMDFLIIFVWLCHVVLFISALLSVGNIFDLESWPLTCILLFTAPIWTLRRLNLKKQKLIKDPQSPSPQMPGLALVRSSYTQFILLTTFNR